MTNMTTQGADFTSNGVPVTLGVTSSQALYDFASDTPGAMPAGFTDRSGGLFTVEDDDSLGHVLRLRTTAGTALQDVFATIDMCDGKSDVDITAKVRASIASGPLNGAYLRSTVQPGGSSYLLYIRANPDVARIAEFGSQVFSVAASATAPFAFTTDAVWLLRARALGNALYYKVWEPNKLEPVGWTVAVNDSTLVSGLFGIGSSSRSAVFTWEWIGVGVDGAPAPTKAEVVGPGNPASNISVFKNGSFSSGIFVRKTTAWVSWPPAVTDPDPAPEPSTIEHGTDLTLADVGIQSGVTLSPDEGRYTTQQNGEVIENRHFSGDGTGGYTVVINHPGVVMRNCLVESGSGGDESAIRVEDRPGTPFLIEHCEIDGEDANFSGMEGNNGIQAFTKMTARRNYIHRTRQAIQLWRTATASTVVENWVSDVHDPGQASSTGISYRGSTSTTAVCTIARNRVSADANACISASARDTSGGPVIGLLIEDNYLISPPNRDIEGTGLKCGYEDAPQFLNTSGYSEDNANIKIRGNRWEGTFSWNNTTHLYSCSSCHPENEWSDNRWINGTLIPE